MSFRTNRRTHKIFPIRSEPEMRMTIETMMAGQKRSDRRIKIVRHYGSLEEAEAGKLRAAQSGYWQNLTIIKLPNENTWSLFATETKKGLEDPEPVIAGAFY